MYQILLVKAKIYFDLIATSDFIYSGRDIIQEILRDCSQFNLIKKYCNTIVSFREGCLKNLNSKCKLFPNWL